MPVETTAILALLLLIAALQLALLLRRAPAPAGVLDGLAELRGALDRQATREGALLGEMKGELARHAADRARESSAFTIEQTRLLNDALRDQKGALDGLGERLAGQERAVSTQLAQDAAATRDALERARVGQETGATQLRTALTEGARAAAATAAAEAQRLRDLLDGRAEASRALIDARLTEMRTSNDAKLADMQRTVNEQLQSAVEKQMTESFSRVIDQFTAVQKAMADVQAVTSQVGDLKRLFSNVTTRGGLGEVQLRALLDDMLAGGYEAQCRVCDQSGECVDFAVLMPMQGRERVLLPIDAKFPTADFERLASAFQAGELEAERAARRGLETRIRLEAAKIAQKYIRPPLTVEFAVLYLPSDALYIEVARLPGLIDDLHRRHKVLVLGPSLLPAMLRTIQLGHLTLQLGRNADAIRETLGAAKVEVRKIEEVMGKLAKQASAFSNTVSDAQKRARIMGGKLRGIDAIEPARAAMLLELDPEPLELAEELLD